MRIYIDKNGEEYYIYSKMEKSLLAKYPGLPAIAIKQTLKIDACKHKRITYSKEWLKECAIQTEINERLQTGL